MYTGTGSRIFNFQKAYSVLDELIIAGELQESSKKSVLRVVSKNSNSNTTGPWEQGSFTFLPLLPFFCFPSSLLDEFTSNTSLVTGDCP